MAGCSTRHRIGGRRRRALLRQGDRLGRSDPGGPVNGFDTRARETWIAVLCVEARKVTVAC